MSEMKVRIIQLTTDYRLLITAFFLASCPVFAYDFAGGIGKPNDPYQIATAEQLVSIGGDPNLLSKHFVLVNDIDLDPNLPGSTVFDDAVILSFSGSFDGRGQCITGLTIVSTRSHAGLFGLIKDGGIVTDLGVLDVSVTVSEAHPWWHVRTKPGTGGLAGENQGKIIRCFCRGNVGGVFRVGVLVGHNQGGIRSCYAEGYASGDHTVGGLVGLNEGKVRACYSAAVVTANEGGVGGVVGGNRGAIMYAYSAIETQQDAETLVPVASDSGITVSSYFLSSVKRTAPNTAGLPLTESEMSIQESFVGWDFYGYDSDGVRDDWFIFEGSHPVLTWQTEFTGMVVVPDISAVSVTRARFLLEDAGLVVGNVEYDYDRSIPKDDVIHARSRPYVLPSEEIDMVVSLGPYDWSVNPGQGTMGHPYQIGSAGQLESLIDAVERRDEHFILAADIDLTGRVYTHPVLGQSAGWHAGPFNGSLDGKYHSIVGLTLEGQTSPWSSINEQPLGLWGEIGTTGLVQDLRLQNARIEGVRNAMVGGLAGSNKGLMINCDVHAVVSGQTTTGGLVGTNTGDVLSCSSEGLVFQFRTRRNSDDPSERATGGLIGRNGGTVSQCHSGSIIQGINTRREYANCLGGLIGIGDTGAVVDCMADGSVLYGNPVGGLIGYNKRGFVMDCAAHATAKTVLSSIVGGLVGLNKNGNIRRCYALSILSAGHKSHLGGLVGHNDDGLLANCYARGSVIVDHYLYMGDLVGGNSGRIVDCHAALYKEIGNTPPTANGIVSVECDGSMTCGYSHGIIQNSFYLEYVPGPTGKHPHGILLNADQMQQQASFTGWDFENVWTICEDRDYPRLRWEEIECSE